MSGERRIVVIGAGVGGLTAAAALAKKGAEVTVLEAGVSPGGCASTYFHQGYRFDAGATLASGFAPGGPMDLVAHECGIADWPARPTTPAMQVHLSDGSSVPWHDREERWEERGEFFGKDALPFFRWQEHTADLLWDFALGMPGWPVKSAGDLRRTLAATSPRLWLESPRLAVQFFQKAAAMLPQGNGRLREAIDAQLLISAQAESGQTAALYAASALDLARRGVVHFEGGIGALSQTLAQAVTAHGGQVRYRQEVTRIQRSSTGYRLWTNKGEEHAADVLVANLTGWDLQRLLEPPLPGRLAHLPQLSPEAWGAGMLYLGVEDSAVPAGSALHHLVVRERPFGDGSTVFVSISPDWDAARAPSGMRALTLSSHTRLNGWWELLAQDPQAYEARKEALAERMLATAERALPGLSSAVRLRLPGTPVTFQRFTRRHRGWVGGFPQTSLFASRTPCIQKDLWLVGDSIFPGQSTAAVALGGLRVARDIQGATGGRPHP